MGNKDVMDLLEHFVREKLSTHPLPWSVEYDWCVEVYDANHGLVTKLMYSEDVSGLVSLAERLGAEAHAAEIEIEKMLSGEDQ
jgi:hypothetical protein